jgi:hypothetical protein
MDLQPRSMQPIELCVSPWDQLGGIQSRGRYHAHGWNRLAQQVLVLPNLACDNLSSHKDMCLLQGRELGVDYGAAPLQCRRVLDSGSVRHSPGLPISYTESFRDLQQSYRDVQQSFRTRDFELECSISAPVRSSVHRNGTYPTLKTFPHFFNYRSFEGVEAPEGCENVA